MKTLLELIFNPAVVSLAMLLLLLVVSLLVSKRLAVSRKQDKESAIPLSKEQAAQYAIERKKCLPSLKENRQSCKSMA